MQKLSGLRRALVIFSLGLVVAVSWFPARVFGASSVAIQTQVLPVGYVGTSYSASMSAEGGTQPYKWCTYNLTPLPRGLGLEENGTITGTPSSPGTYSFDVQAYDATSGFSIGCLLTTGVPAQKFLTVTILPQAVSPQKVRALLPNLDVTDDQLGQALVARDTSQAGDPPIWTEVQALEVVQEERQAWGWAVNESSTGADVGQLVQPVLALSQFLLTASADWANPTESLPGVIGEILGIQNMYEDWAGLEQFVATAKDFSNVHSTEDQNAFISCSAQWLQNTQDESAWQTCLQNEVPAGQNAFVATAEQTLVPLGQQIFNVLQTSAFTDEQAALTSEINGMTFSTPSGSGGGQSSSVFPTITAVGPNPIPASDSNQWLAITGSGFAPGDTVTLRGSGLTDSVPASSVQVVGGNELRVNVDLTAKTATWSVQVTNPQGQSSHAIFRVAASSASPSITSISPFPVPGSGSYQWLTIYGTRFGKGDTVTLTTQRQAYLVPLGRTKYVNPQEIQVDVDVTTAAAGWTAQVMNLSRQTSNIFDFSVAEPTGLSAPKLTAKATCDGSIPEIDLSWTAVPGANEYALYRSPAWSNGSSTYEVPPGWTTFRNIGPLAGHKYTYRVAAMENGIAGPVSAAVTEIASKECTTSATGLCLPIVWAKATSSYTIGPSGGPPENAFACDPNIGWNAGAYTASIEAKYADPATVVGITFLTSSSPSTQEVFSIYGSLDGSNWTLLNVSTQAVSSEHTTLASVRFAPTVLQYLRFDVNGEASWGWLSDVQLVTSQ